MSTLKIREMLVRIMEYYRWTQQDLANYFKLNKSQVTRWMSGNQIPRAETYNAIKEKYDEIQAA